jgi:hypothetical protein
VRRLALEWIAALSDAKEYNGNRDHQEDVYQTPDREGCADAEQHRLTRTMSSVEGMMMDLSDLRKGTSVARGRSVLLCTVSCLACS